MEDSLRGLKQHERLFSSDEGFFVWADDVGAFIKYG